MAAIDSQSNILFTGVTNGSIDFGGGHVEPAGNNALMLARLDANATWLWSRFFNGVPGGLFQEPWVAASPTGRVAFGGNNIGNAVDFGGGNVVSTQGMQDVLVGELWP